MTTAEKLYARLCSEYGLGVHEVLFILEQCQKAANSGLALARLEELENEFCKLIGGVQ